ncbi:MAG: FAD:protein FMN transferase [Bacteroidales bacterium]|jgi:thiamine biosynthesis lipoprotein|nr:FAD:protein FMN transferase [Bacteroidales bacterium]
MKKTDCISMRTVVWCWAVVLFCFSSCRNAEKQYHLQGFAQGTYYSIRYYDHQNRNLQTQIDSLLDDFNKTASIFDTSSIISKINRNEDVLLNDDFVEIFNLAMEVSRNTDGAFDMTVARLVDAWGFGAEKRQTLNKEMIDSLLECVGYEKVALKNGKVIKENPCICLNFNAIAKGYSVDKVGRFLDNSGIENYLVDIGGEVFAKGHNQTNPWTVGIEQPSPTKETADRKVISAVELNNRSLATSGNYRRYFEEDGMRYAHTISPKTGYPVNHTLLSATVLHPKTACADAYATAFMVMGLEQSLAFLANKPQIQVFFIYEDRDTLKTFQTKSFLKQR